MLEAYLWSKWTGVESRGTNHTSVWLRKHSNLLYTWDVFIREMSLQIRGYRNDWLAYYLYHLDGYKHASFLKFPIYFFLNFCVFNWRMIIGYTSEAQMCYFETLQSTYLLLYYLAFLCGENNFDILLLLWNTQYIIIDYNRWFQAIVCQDFVSSNRYFGSLDQDCPFLSATSLCMQTPIWFSSVLDVLDFTCKCEITQCWHLCVLAYSS